MHDRANLIAHNFAEANDFAWHPDQDIDGAGDIVTQRRNAFGRITSEIIELQMLMQDDRERYLDETEAQADGVPDYFLHFIGASAARHPWTIELISCGLAISNIVYMYYKAHFKRVRPSLLCPGLIPPFGPPAHPAFPSGHSTASHLIALLLLEIPALRRTIRSL